MKMKQKKKALKESKKENTKYKKRKNFSFVLYYITN